MAEKTIYKAGEVCYNCNMKSPKYHEMWRKVQAGEISESEWRDFCSTLFEQILDKNKDVMTRLKHR